MIVFVDESGDAGLKLAQGSSAFFVLVLVVFSDDNELAAIDERIDLLRRELDLHPLYEFKFHKCRPAHRLAFLQAAAPYDFFYYGIAINKAGLYGPGFKVKESFYKYAAQLVFLNAREHLENAAIYIDASGDREFRRQFVAYLKKRINEKKRHIKSVGFLNSANSNLIQLADMAAGAVRRSLGDKPDAEDYVRLIRIRQAGLQIWPALKKVNPNPSPCGHARRRRQFGVWVRKQYNRL